MTPFHRRFVRTTPGRAASLLSTTLLVAACASAPAAAAPATSVPQPATSQAAPASPAPSPKPSVAASIALVPTVSAEPDAADSMVHLKLVAAKVKFDLAAMTAPADKSWHIDFDMQDGTAANATLKHDVAIAAGATTRAGDLPYEARIFTSKAYTLGKYTIDVPGLPAGSYTFWCTVHPISMSGILTIK